MGFETVIYEKKGRVAYIYLNRPHVLNAYSVRMRDELFEVFGAVRDDDEVHVVILSGKGEKAFCAGADLSEFLSAPSTIEARQIRFRRDIWGILNSLAQPVICGLYGYVLGSGLEMALFCDIRICSTDAVFGMPEASLGIIPGAGGTQTLARIVGVGKALELLLTGRWIDASQAYEAGLVNMVVERRDLIPMCEELANRILSFDQQIVRQIKELVKRGTEMSLQDGMYLEALYAQSAALRRAHEHR